MIRRRFIARYFAWFGAFFPCVPARPFGLAQTNQSYRLLAAPARTRPRSRGEVQAGVRHSLNCRKLQESACNLQVLAPFAAAVTSRTRRGKSRVRPISVKAYVAFAAQLDVSGMPSACTSTQPGLLGFVPNVSESLGERSW